MKNDEMNKYSGMTPDELEAADRAAFWEQHRLEREIEAKKAELGELEEQLCKVSEELLSIARAAKDDRGIRVYENRIKRFAAYKRLRVIDEELSWSSEVHDCLNDLSPDDDKELLECVAAGIVCHFPDIMDGARRQLEWRKECEARKAGTDGQS